MKPYPAVVSTSAGFSAKQNPNENRKKEKAVCFAASDDKHLTITGKRIVSWMAAFAQVGAAKL